MTQIKPEYLRLLATIVLFALAMGLRLGAVNGITITHPIRADANDYYNYALNLKYHKTYSRSEFSDTAPKPDAVRAPGQGHVAVGLKTYVGQDGIGFLTGTKLPAARQSFQYG